MSYKVLVADDSLTIQKVIGITLANTGHILTECLNESDLLIKVKGEQYDLILLDFNLSDSKTGYDLAKTIKSFQQNSPILILLGTFDSIDETKFKDSGIADKIVKPFESSKFIKKCKQLIEEKNEFSSSVSLDIENVVPAQNDGSENNLDLWTVDAPKKNTDDTFSSLDTLDNASDLHSRSVDPLANEMQGWGFTPSADISGPGIIGGDDFLNITMPDAISEFNTADNNLVISKLQSASNFSIDDEDDFLKDATDPHITITDDKREILGAVEDDISPDSFWAVDEVVPVESEEIFHLDDTDFSKEDITADLTNVLEEYKTQEVSLGDNQISQTDHTVLDEKKIVEELKTHLTPLIEKWIKEACRESVDKVAWEVIPDLAENLIRKEIKELSESVRH